MSNTASSVLLDLMNNYSYSNPNFMNAFIPFVIAQTFGFGAYIYAIIIVIKEKKSCYPPFVHTFFLAIMLLLSILAGFAPNGLGMWTALSPYFDTLEFYFMGIITTIVAIYNIVLLKKYPPKPKRADGKSNVW